MANVVVVEGEDGRYHGFGLLKEGMRTTRKANVQSSRDQWEEWESHAMVQEAQACSAKQKSHYQMQAQAGSPGPGECFIRLTDPFKLGIFRQCRFETGILLSLKD